MFLITKNWYNLLKPELECDEFKKFQQFLNNEYAKYKITVPNSVDIIKNIKDIQTTKVSGGQGALREVADCLLNQL